VRPAPRRPVGALERRAEGEVAGLERRDRVGRPLRGERQPVGRPAARVEVVRMRERHVGEGQHTGQHGVVVGRGRPGLHEQLPAQVRGARDGVHQAGRSGEPGPPGRVLLLRERAIGQHRRALLRRPHLHRPAELRRREDGPPAQVVVAGPQRPLGHVEQSLGVTLQAAEPAGVGALDLEPQPLQRIEVVLARRHGLGVPLGGLRVGLRGDGVDARACRGVDRGQRVEVDGAEQVPGPVRR
jgi:hypothetical protein